MTRKAMHHEADGRACRTKWILCLVVSTLWLAILTTGCASTGAADAQEVDPKEKTDIERRLHEVLDAAESKDFDRLDSYHLYGPKFTKFSGASPERLDAAAGRKGEHDGLGAVQDLQMRVDGLKIDVFGNVAIATFILDYSFAAGGVAVQRKERSTLVFVKEHESWKIAHEHLSPIQN